MEKKREGERNNQRRWRGINERKCLTLFCSHEELKSKKTQYDVTVHKTLQISSECKHNIDHMKQLTSMPSIDIDFIDILISKR